jgi:tRNA(Ile2) C34 agmatinyltransferase TiaS
MNVHASCPCCSESMLHHLSGRRNYWYCSHCRLEMPYSVSPKVERRKKQAVKFDQRSEIISIPVLQSELPAIA